MGFLSSLKKLFFATESVAKSAADKTADYAKEKGSDLIDKTKDLASNAGETIMEKTSGLREAVTEKAEDFAEKAKDIAEDVVESVENVASTVSEKAKNVIEDVSESDIIQSAKEKVGGIIGESDDLENEEKEKENSGDGILSKAGSIVAGAGATAAALGGAALDKAKNVANDLGETEVVKSAANISEKVGDKVLDAGEAFMEKAKDVAESVGSKVLDTGGEAMEKAGSISESLGEKVLDAKDAIVEKAKEVTADLGEKLDETIEKAEKMAAEEAATPKKEFSDETLDAGGSLLDGTDDFFSKADRFAEGDYGAFSEGKIEINDDVSATPAKPIAKAGGFTDHDGDGNEMIDDAIISEEE